MRACQVDPGDLIEPGDRAGQQCSLRGDALIHRGDVSADRIDAAQRTTAGISTPWSSSPPGDLRITSVSRGLLTGSQSPR
jgi:hypothetical protein